jgi:peptidoglycan hydrolase CwlO-like protein
MLNSDTANLGLNNIQESIAEMSPDIRRISDDVTSLSTTVNNLVSQVISVHNEVQSLEGGLKMACNEIAITAKKLAILLPIATQHIKVHFQLTK